MTTIHEALANARVLQELRVIHTVVQQHEGTAVLFTGTDKFTLSTHHPFYGVPVIVTIDEQVWNKF